MSERTKHRVERFSFYDHTGMEKHFEKMAEKGWLLTAIHNFTWEYRRIEPKKLHFAVTYDPKASEFDPEPQEGQLIYRDYSEHYGWKFAASSAQLQIFYNEEMDPVPLDTDPVVEVMMIHKAAKKGFLPLYGILLALSVLQAALFISSLLGDPVRLLSSTTQLTTGFLWMLVFLLSIVELAGYIRWHRKAVRAAENGVFFDTPSYAQFQMGILLAAAAAILYLLLNLFSIGDKMQLTLYLLLLVCTLGLNITVVGVKELMKKRKATRIVNLTITMMANLVVSIAMIAGITYVIITAVRNGGFGSYPEAGSKDEILYQVELPLAVEDLLDVDFDGYIRENRQSESVFLGQRTMRQWARYTYPSNEQVPEMTYTVTIVKVPAIYNFCKNSILKKTKDIVEADGTLFTNHYEETDAAVWLAEEAYQLRWSDSTVYRYLLCYPDRLIKIGFDYWEPTEEQMRIVAEKLAGK